MNVISTVVSRGRRRPRVTDEKRFVLYTRRTGGEERVIFHQVWDSEEGFAHRIKMGSRTSQWCSYHQIATIAFESGVAYCAVTDYYAGQFPEVFHVEPARPEKK